MMNEIRVGQLAWLHIKLSAPTVTASGSGLAKRPGNGPAGTVRPAVTPPVKAAAAPGAWSGRAGSGPAPAPAF